MPLTLKLRENFIVENDADFNQAVINNLSVFFDTFPLRLEYIVRQVSSIQLADGSRLTGEVMQVRTTKKSNGSWNYKTIVNKFLVLDIYLLLSQYQKKKIARVVLAPVNILAFKKTYAQLLEMSKGINALIKGELQKFVVTTPTTPEPVKLKGWWAEIEIPPFFYKIGPYATREIADAAVYDEYQPYKQKGIRFTEVKFKEIEPDLPYLPNAKGNIKPLTAPAPDTTPDVNGGATGPKKLGAEAMTLFEWYQAQGQAVPSVAERGVVYENFNLGPKNTYVGTGEQNLALLLKLKAQ